MSRFRGRFGLAVAIKNLSRYPDTRGLFAPQIATIGCDVCKEIRRSISSSSDRDSLRASGDRYFGSSAKAELAANTRTRTAISIFIRSKKDYTEFFALIPL